MKFILASSSPRRRALLEQAGYEFDVIPSDVDEEQYPKNLLPPEIALHLAAEKAAFVVDLHPNAIVLAADTVVAFGDMPIGKPKDLADARTILTLLSGTTHLVVTGIVVRHKATNFQRRARVMSAVRMRNLTEAELEKYLATGLWQGKAGAYGIQDEETLGFSEPFVTRLSGSRSNIVGLPMRSVRVLLGEAGVEPATTKVCDD